jgi:hypothetical protein
VSGILGNRAGDRVIEAAIRGPELINLDGSVRLNRQIGDGLANVAVIPNRLLESESLCEQISPVKRKRLGNHTLPQISDS